MFTINLSEILRERVTKSLKRVNMVWEIVEPKCIEFSKREEIEKLEQINLLIDELENILMDTAFYIDRGY